MQTTQIARLGLVMLLVAACPALADYATPGTGVDWTMDQLVANAGGAVTGSAGVYQVHEAFFISLNDRLAIEPGVVLTFVDTGGTVGLEVNGSLEALGTAADPIVFTGLAATPGSWRGLDHRDTGPGSAFVLQHCEIAFADEAVDVFGADIDLDQCEIHHSLSKALDISQGNGTVTACTFHDNQQRTVTLTLSASPTIELCHFENNNQENSSPYPYISIGLQGVNSPTIRGNTILGSGQEISGGISLWNASNALIQDNHIEGCGYGILCFQTGANPLIIGNSIIANNIHPDTVNWGFGIACNGDNAPIVMNNIIRGHWYGVAAINGGRPNLGDLVNDFPGDDGGNIIDLNGLDGQIYGFYNNTPLTQMAQGNWWGGIGPDVVEDAIFHFVDDPALGLVNFDFYLEISAAADGPPPRRTIASVAAFPNPFNPRVSIELSLARDSHTVVVVLDVAGRLLRELQVGDLRAGEHAFTWDGNDRAGRPLPSGAYFYRVVTGAEAQSGKVMLVR